jgi:hypothetical protein
MSLNISWGIGKMQVVSAHRAINKIPNGCTKPYYIACSDGNQYAVKFKENPEGPRVLVNEYVCAKIAEVLELPLASPSFIEIDQNFISVYGQQIEEHVGKRITPGLHFGTKKIRKAFQIYDSTMLQEAVNVDCIPDIILFDHLICNTDRESNGGNLIFDASNMSIVIIDHTHAFDLGPIWTAHDLRQRIGEPFTIFNTSGYIYKKLVPYVKGHNPFSNILKKMKRLTPDLLFDIILNIPEEWNVTLDEKHALHEYLVDRLNRIENVLPQLKHVLPYWKGGS